MLIDVASTGSRGVGRARRQRGAARSTDEGLHGGAREPPQAGEEASRPRSTGSARCRATSPTPPATVRGSTCTSRSPSRTTSAAGRTAMAMLTSTHRTGRRVVAAMVAVLTATLGLLSGCAGSSGTTVTARFSDAAGLFTGNDVGVLGVRVGEVTKITPRGDRVDVTLSIDSGREDPGRRRCGGRGHGRSPPTATSSSHRSTTPARCCRAVPCSTRAARVRRSSSTTCWRRCAASPTTCPARTARPNRSTTCWTVGAETLDGNGATIAQGLRDLATPSTPSNGMSDDAVGNLENLDILTAALADNDELVRAVHARRWRTPRRCSTTSTSRWRRRSTRWRRWCVRSRSSRATIAPRSATRSRTCSRSSASMVEKRKGLERLLRDHPADDAEREPGDRRERPDQLPDPTGRPRPGQRGVPGAVLELPPWRLRRSGQPPPRPCSTCSSCIAGVKTGADERRRATGQLVVMAALAAAADARRRPRTCRCPAAASAGRRTASWRSSRTPSTWPTARR